MTRPTTQLAHRLALVAAALVVGLAGCGPTTTQTQTMKRLRTLNDQLETERQERLVDQARGSGQRPVSKSKALASAPAATVGAPAPLRRDRLVVQGPRPKSESDTVTAAWRVLVQELRVMRREARQDLAKERKRMRRLVMADARDRELRFLREQVLRLRLSTPWAMAPASGKRSARALAAQMAQLRKEGQRVERLRRDLERLERRARRGPASRPVAKRPLTPEQKRTAQLVAQLEAQRRAMQEIRKGMAAKKPVARAVPKTPRDLELERLKKQLAVARAAEAARAEKAALAAQAAREAAAAKAKAAPAKVASPGVAAPARPTGKRKSVDAQGELDSQAGEAEALLRAQLKGKTKPKGK